jgi:Tol biopolymer transport system component
MFVSGRKLPGQPEGPRITVIDLASHRPRVLDLCAGRCQFIGEAVWSPDGRQIAFAASNRYVAPTIPGFPGIAPRYTLVFVVNSDGTAIHRVVAAKDISGLDWQPGG